jgi:hypothetical protein
MNFLLNGEIEKKNLYNKRIKRMSTKTEKNNIS